MQEKQAGWKWSRPSAKRSWDVGEVDQVHEEVNLISCLIAGLNLASLREDPHASVPPYVTLICVSLPFIMTLTDITSNYVWLDNPTLNVCKSPIPHLCTFFSICLSPGAFIIPFLVMLLVVGMPLLLLELALGQKLRVGAARAWYKVKNLNCYCHVHCPLLWNIKFEPVCPGAPSPWWNRVWFNSGCRPRRMLLQRHHCLVHLLPVVIHECE